MKYFVIADENTVRGFSLLGVDGAIVSVDCSSEQARLQAKPLACDAFENALAYKNLGAIIISAPVASLIEVLIAKHNQSGKFPQVMEIGEDVCSVLRS